MSEWPDAPAVCAFLARATHRIRWVAALRGAAAGLAAALVLAVIAWLSGWRGLSLPFSALFAIIAFAIGALVAVRKQPRVAQLIEQRHPCRNLVITAAELIERPGRVRAWIGERVCRDAARTVAALDPSVLFPARGAVIMLSAVVAAWVIVIPVVAAVPAVRPQPQSDPGRSATISAVDVTITPPPYTRRRAQTLHDPASIVILAGSRIHLSVRGTAAAVAVETIDGRQSLASAAQDVFAGEVVAAADGYIAIEPIGATGRPGARRLIGLTVQSDAMPRVRVTLPGRDLIFDGPNRNIAVRIEADDDMALASLTLRYTRVSGSGEQFTFTEGDIPVDITRTDDMHWSARATLRLAALVPSPGDMLVYRAMATDGRPNASPAESDAFIVEIRSPGSVAAEGFAIDDEQDRYAISQQMVILHTERLAARAGRLPADSVAAGAQTIAAAQRAVRAEFVFMMGGELAEEVLAAASMEDLNEEAHAEADDEAIAGRLANQGRVALLQAIRAMSRANTALIASDLARALTEEKTALANLQRAFSRTRHILRALTERERLDYSRRLTGTLATAGRSIQPVPEPQPDLRTRTLREAIAGIAEVAGETTFSGEAAARLTTVADRVLRQNPSHDPLQKIAATLYDAAAAIGANRDAQARELLDQAAAALTATLRSDLPAAPAQPQPRELARLRGALIDAGRRPGGSK